VSTMTDTDLYLRLSDLRNEEALDGRVEKLKAEAARLGWHVPDDGVIVENDLTEGANGNGRSRPASAFKRKKITTPSGRVELRTVRPGFRRVLDDIVRRGRNLLAEDLDRACRDPRDLEDLIDACEQHRASARSLSGSLTFTSGGTDAEITMARMMVAVGNKESRDKARRVAAARERLAGQSWHGGPRPYGFVPDADAPKYHKRLIVVDAEAGVLQQAAADVLDKNISIKSVAADLRDRRVPTATGAAWSAETLKDCLLNDAVTGLTDPAGNVVWPAIIEQDVQDRLRDLLASDSREVFGYRKEKVTDPQTGKTRTVRTRELIIDPQTGKPKVFQVTRNASAAGSAARWLLSGIATCGVCGGAVRCTGGSNRRAYTCTSDGHVRRDAARVDDHVSAQVIKLLRRELPHLFLPAPKVTADTAGLRAEARKLSAKRDDLARLYTEEILTEVGVRRERKRIDARLAAIAAELAASDQVDPLPEFRAPDVDAAAVWYSLSLARRRSVLKLLYDIEIRPGQRGGRMSDEVFAGTVKMTRKSA
jgi:site-specific DNA recombinase